MTNDELQAAEQKQLDKLNNKMLKEQAKLQK